MSLTCLYDLTVVFGLLPLLPPLALPLLQLLPLRRRLPLALTLPWLLLLLLPLWPKRLWRQGSSFLRLRSGLRPRLPELLK